MFRLHETILDQVDQEYERTRSKMECAEWLKRHFINKGILLTHLESLRLVDGILDLDRDQRMSISRGYYSFDANDPSKYTSLDGKPEFLISIAGMFDPSIKAECDFIKAALRLKVKNWMKERVIDAHHDKADELIRWGEVNLTRLAEECVYDSKIWPEHLHMEILDEETHWVWDLAVDVAKAYEQDKLDLDP